MIELICINGNKEIVVLDVFTNWNDAFQGLNSFKIAYNGLTLDLRYKGE